MDWKGQKLAEDLMQYVIVAFGVVAFAVGYFKSSFPLMIQIFCGGVVLAAILVLVNWPFYNRQGLKWIDAKTASAAADRDFKGPPVVIKPKKQKTNKKSTP